MYHLKFKGNKTKNKSSVLNYCDLKVDCNNFIWMEYTPTHLGEFQIETSTKLDTFLLFIFEASGDEFCDEIKAKKAKLVTCEQRTSQDTSFQIYKALQNQNYVIALYAAKSKVDPIDVAIQYTPLNEKGQIFKDSLMLNLVFHSDQPVLGIHFRDEITLYPVIARMYLSASSMIDGTYRASDILVNNQKRLKANIKVDAEGYYSKDISGHLILNTTHHDTIWLTPISRGSITKLDDLYFSGGLAVILEESIPRLKRLKDFLLLNPDISIEVQGHVNDEGGNSVSSLRLSKKRAQKVVDYLINSGIDPSRLTAIGFGNSKPIFKSPVSDEEREANRRVEVKIK